jgi:cell division protein FtsI (penicillin-binding protein 3)|tara:strand:- start:1364 stop:3097 length:1734 start_codon:yes stop_codon:yes gene_type:complete
MKNKKNKNPIHQNQKSFFFEDFLETNQKQKIIYKSRITDERLYVLFTVFFSLILIFSISIFSISIQSSNFQVYKQESKNSLILRRDVVDRNGELIARNINAYHAAVKPDLIKNKENFAINIKLNFPEISLPELKKNLNSKKYFYLKKRLTEEEKNKLWSFGEKGIIIEPFQNRVYPHGKLFSHVLGQIDDDNYGVSGIEKFFDKKLRNKKKINDPLFLALDSNIQFLINVELKKAMEDFKAKAAGALLMNVNNGEVLSLVSLPDYNVNIRKNLTDPNYMNQITKGIFELGSVFKTFTLALAIEENILLPDTIIDNIPNQIKCSKYPIRDIHEFPEKLSAEDILIRSSNIGSLMIGRKIGKEKLKRFLEDLGLLNAIDFELEEVGKPLNFKWEKCKLETVSFGHGITTTPLQAAAAYGSIVNGGYIIKPTLRLLENFDTSNQKSIISKSTSDQMNKILRKVVTDKEGTGSFANIFGYDVGGKTGTAKSYIDKNVNINTFISIFPSQNPKYVMLIILDDPKGAPHISYNYRGQVVKNISRNEAGWNSVYVAGKIIEKIGPILAINNNEVHNTHVVKKNN